MPNKPMSREDMIYRINEYVVEADSFFNKYDHVICADKIPYIIDLIQKNTHKGNEGLINELETLIARLESDPDENTNEANGVYKAIEVVKSSTLNSSEEWVDVEEAKKVAYKKGFEFGSKREDEFRNKLEDVVNELDLSECMINEHGQHGTPPSELVRLVLEEKDRKIFMLSSGLKDINTPTGDK